MEALKKAVETRTSPIMFGGRTGTRGKVISLRVSEKLEQLIEKQAQEWNMSVSDTLRSILNFYFLPPLLLEAWNNKVEKLIEVDTEARGKNMETVGAPTQAQRIEHVLVNSDEAEEYSKFIAGLWEMNEEYFEALRAEAIAIHGIAVKMLTKDVEAMENMKDKLPTREELNEMKEELEQRSVEP